MPVEKYRDAQWLAVNGITPSIMDYARYNYIARPEDSIHSDRGRFFSIGAYDEWAIKMGYFYLGNTRVVDGVDSPAVVPGFVAQRCPQFFLPYEDVDMRAVGESLGDDHVLASEYGMQNIRRIMAQFPYWAARYDYDSLMITDRLQAFNIV